MNFKDFTMPKLPTDAEIRKNSLPAWQKVKPVMLSSLDSAILEMSMPTFFAHVSTQEILDFWICGFDGKGTFADKRLVDFGKQALDIFPDGFFFKMDSRSPKDYGIIKYTKENLHELPTALFSSMRMMDDLCVQTRHRTNFFLCFRKWVELSDEHRVFVKDGQRQGVSRYDYNTPPPPLGAPDDRYLEIASKYILKINPYIGLKDYVFDFGFDEDGNEILIELNPYGLSDPCCFVSYDNISGYLDKILD